MKNYLIYIVIFIFSASIFAQEPSDILKEVYKDGEYFFAREEYVDALSEYRILIKRGYDNSNINYRIGVCYLRIPGEKVESIPYLEKAVENVSVEYKEGSLKETKAPLDAYLFLGNAYRIGNKLDKAIEAYTKFIDKSLEENLMVEYAESQIQACLRAKELIETPVVLNATNLGEKINSSSANYAGVISGDGQTLVYMFELPFYDAVYLSKKDENGEWGDPTNLSPQIQSDGDQFVASISYDGTELYLVREDLFNSDIYYSQLGEDGNWTPSSPLPRGINSKYWESHASVSRYGDTLYFTSNNKESIGEMDIFMVIKGADGKWSNAINVGNVINTKMNEEYPFITENGKRLYFSSQGHEGIGGYDIFYSEKDTLGNWTKPVNVGYPVNSTDDDMFFAPYKNGKFGLKSIIDSNGYGKEDIYLLELVDLKKQELRIAQDIEDDAEEEIENQLVDTVEVIDEVEEDEQLP